MPRKTSKKGGDIITTVASLVAPTGINPLVATLGLTALAKKTTTKKSQKGGNPNSNGSTYFPPQFYDASASAPATQAKTMKQAPTGSCGRINATSAPCRNLCPFPNASSSQYGGKKKTPAKKTTKKKTTKKVPKKK